MANVKLWIGNFAPETTDEDLHALVNTYAPGQTCSKLERIEGDGSRPAAILDYAQAPDAAVETMAKRLHGMFWKGRKLFVQTIAR